MLPSAHERPPDAHLELSCSGAGECDNEDLIDSERGFHNQPRHEMLDGIGFSRPRGGLQKMHAFHREVAILNSKNLFHGPSNWQRRGLKSILRSAAQSVYSFLGCKAMDPLFIHSK